MGKLPHSVLFCCDYNATRSPMAEGMMKKYYGSEVYVQSVGVKSDLETDGFAIAVCAEIGVDLQLHRARAFHEMQELGDDLSAFDLVIALSPAAFAKATELSRYHHIEVVHWDILDPTGKGEGREERLVQYRRTRDQIRDHILARFGAPINEG